jgi:hypothetical protein
METNFEGIDTDIQDVIKKVLSEVFAQYPEVEKRLNYLGVPNREYFKASEMICHVSSYGDELIITTKINDVNEDLDAISGWAIPGIKAKILHELGHLIDFTIQQSHCNIAARTQNSKDYRNGVRSLYRQFRADKSSTISRYAREDEKEFVAEVFAQMGVCGKTENEYTTAYSALLGAITEEDIGQRA